MRTALVDEMKRADVFEIISPVTGSLCRPAVGCSEAIVLTGAEKQGRALDRKGDLIEADSGLKKKDALCIHLQSPPWYQTLSIM